MTRGDGVTVNAAQLFEWEVMIGNNPVRFMHAVCMGTVAMFLASTGMRAEDGGSCGAPAVMADNWPVVAQVQSGVDPKQLCAMIDWLDGLKGANVHSVLVVRRGKLVFEHYRTGADERRGSSIGAITFGPDVKHDLRSVSKSVTSLLVGIALDRKLIASLDAPVYRFFPEFDDLRSEARDRITLRHLLTMSSGLEWDENIPYTDPANSEIRMIFAPDPFRFAWEQKLVTPPGESYNYNGGSTELLGRIVQKVSGQSLEQFAKANLFEPLGITDFEWSVNPSGFAAAASGVRLRPRDMARLGQLLLQRGKWDGRQIVSETWIGDATATQIAGSQLYFYGYQWWLGRSLVNQKELTWTAGVGLGGQRVFVVPSLDLVVVVTAGMYKSPMQAWVPLVLLNRVLKAAS